MKRIFSISIIALLLSFTAAAQGNPSFPQVSPFYSYALPLGYMKENVVSKGSARGAGLEFSWKIADKWRLGGSIGYQDLYDKGERQLFKPDASTDISAVVSHSIQTYPVLVKATFLPLAAKTSALQPYLQAGAGGALVAFRELWGVFDVANSFGLSPAFSAGGGIQYTVGKAKNTQVFLGANYNIIPYNKNEVSSLNTLQFQLGVRLRAMGSRDNGYYQQTPAPRYYR